MTLLDGDDDNIVAEERVLNNYEAIGHREKCIHHFLGTKQSKITKKLLRIAKNEFIIFGALSKTKLKK